MMKKRMLYSKVEDFLLDDDFIRYTFDATAEGERLWADYLVVTHPAHSTFLRATNILLHLDECKLLTESQVRRLKQRISRSLHAVAS